jgi:hypothetical protein
MDELGILSIPHLYTSRVASEMHSYVYPKSPTDRPENHHNYTPVAQVHEHGTRLSLQGHHYIPNPFQYAANSTQDLTRSHLTHIYTATWNTLLT